MFVAMYIMVQINSNIIINTFNWSAFFLVIFVLLRNIYETIWAVGGEDGENLKKVNLFTITAYPTLLLTCNIHIPEVKICITK